MKLALLGATGGVGREVLSQAIAAGHAVTAVVRNPSKLPADVDVVRQDLANPDLEVLAAAMRDVDAVISAVGPHRAAEAGIVAPATAAITHAMDCAGVRRLVVISAAPVGRRAFDPPTTSASLRPRRRPADALPSSALSSGDSSAPSTPTSPPWKTCCGTGAWTGPPIRPPRLTNGPLTGTYRTAIDRNVRHGLTISRRDVAHLMLTVLQQPETVRHAVGVAY